MTIAQRIAKHNHRRKAFIISFMASFVVVGAGTLFASSFIFEDTIEYLNMLDRGEVVGLVDNDNQVGGYEVSQVGKGGNLKVNSTKGGFKVEGLAGSYTDTTEVVDGCNTIYMEFTNNSIYATNCVFEVTFLDADLSLISTRLYSYREKVRVPELSNITKNGKEYTFDSWNHDIEKYAMHDYTYIATYSLID